MFGSSQDPWSNDPWAPQLTYRQYFAEKMNFAGFLIGTICYGIVVVLFFHCMSALLNPTNRRKAGTRWGLIAHTVAMFSFVTIYTALNLTIQSISYINNRNFPGDESNSFPGPFGYQIYISSKAISVVPSVMFTLNNWLADGLLLYRCYITYAKNYWVIAFPFLVYLGTFAMGIAFIYQFARPVSHVSNPGTIEDFGIPYYSISLALNAILTLMIVGRLIIHGKNVRNAMGSPSGASGLYKAIVAMLVESCALYAVSYLLFMAPWAASSPVTNAFFPILAETQVIAPYLIIIRVANRRAFTSESIASGNASSLRFRSGGGWEGGDGVHPDGRPVNSASPYGETLNELSVGATTIDLPHDKV